MPPPRASVTATTMTHNRPHHERSSHTPPRRSVAARSVCAGSFVPTAQLQTYLANLFTKPTISALMSDSTQYITVARMLPDDLNAVRKARQALALCPLEHPNRLDLLDDLATAVRKTFEQFGDLDALEEVVELYRQALNLRLPEHPQRPACLSDLANVLQTRFEELGDLDSLAEAIELHRQALALFLPESSGHMICLGNLANAMQLRFNVFGDLNSLSEAIDLHRKALDLCPPGNLDRTISLRNLASALHTRFEQLDDHGSLAEAVGLHRQALDLCPLGHPDRSVSLKRLADALRMSFVAPTHLELDSLAEVVDLYRQALTLHPPGHPARSASLDDLANALHTQFEHLGDLNVLAESIKLHRQALTLRPSRHPGRSASLNNLANALQTQFEQLDDLDALVEAVELHSQALALRPPGHPDRSTSLGNLAHALKTRVERLGDFDSLGEIVELYRQALGLRPPGNPGRTIALINLADALHMQVRQLGYLDSLAEIIELNRQALTLRPAGHPDRSMSFNNLANALISRFEKFRDFNALAEAIELHRQALALRQPGHPDRSMTLNNLANSLQTRAEQLGDFDSFAQTVELYRQSLNLRPKGHLLHAVSLSNLANALGTLYVQFGDPASLVEAIDLHRQSLDLRPHGHPLRPSSLINLATALHLQSQQLEDISSASGEQFSSPPHLSHLDEEFILYKEGLAACADGHPMRIFFLFAIGQCMLRARKYAFNFTEGIGHILKALQDGTSPAAQSLGRAIDALHAVEAAYQFLIEHPDDLGFESHLHKDLILQVYILVIRLVPRAASFGLDHAKRLIMLSGIETVSRDAVARAIEAGRDTEAVELLEEGRGVFWSQALQLRTTELNLLPAAEARKLRTLFQMLEVGSTGDESTSVVQREWLLEHRRQLSNAVEAMIADIRSRPDMSRFLLPPAFVSLVQSLPEGFFVFLNISDLGHHALVLDGTVKSAHSVPLRLPSRVLGAKRRAVPQSTSKIPSVIAVASETGSEKSIVRNEGEEQLRAEIRERATFEDSLADLWVFIVKPVVIDLLQLKKSNGCERPRVWWCPTGNLTFLPIHAAGVYTKAARERSGASNDCASNYVVSSYISSISTLVRARSGSRSMPRSEIQGLLIHEGSPGRGWSSIPKVKDEVRRVRERFDKGGVSATVLNDTTVHPIVPDILAALTKTQMHVLHLACHGSQKVDPLSSAFIFRDEDLTIRDLLKLEMKQAWLAFLSACQTAKGNQDQPDQAVHLAASMLFCGFKSVIATMWTMSDVDGPMIADSFYEAVLKEEMFDLNVVPYALDDAVKSLRDRKVEARRWSVFVHMGA